MNHLQMNEVKHVMCKFCKEDGKNKWHQWSDFLDVPIEECGIKVNLFWCHHQLSSHIAIQKEILEAVRARMEIIYEKK